jgi:prepilin-type N-terminal cleavage/methylation domain-containing protein
MKTNSTRRRGFTLVELLVVIVIIAALAGLTAPMVIRQRKKADQTEATSNARQIGFAMFEFETEFGSFPDTSTLTEVNDIFGDAVVKGAAGTDSNGYFKQLMQAGITQSEAMFYAKTPLSRKPDGDISTDAEALANGEVGFGYITNGVGVGMSTAGNPARVLVATPLIADGSQFDGDPYDRKAVILRIDNSASSVNIVPTAGATVGPAIVGGEDLMSATNPIWGSTTPTMNPPISK